MQSVSEMPLKADRSRLRMICPAYPAFNIYSRPAKHMTALGPVSIATAVRDLPGWDAEIVDENNYHRGPLDETGMPDHRTFQEDRPAEVVGLYGGLTSTVPRLLEIAQLYKSLGAVTIAGGQHFVPQTVEHALRNGVDVIVLGEGEHTIAELLDVLGRDGELAKVKGIAYIDRADELVITPPREPIRDFDRLPLPDFGLLRHANMKYYPVSGTRGCRMHCEFCSVKGEPRFASPRRMMEQFASIHETHGGRVFFVVDDLFGQNRRETLELCRMLRDYQQRLGVRFSITVQIRLDMARDDELLTAMREAGVRLLAIGFESPIAAELEAMGKQLRPEDMLKLVDRYHDAGFRIHGMFIFGYPAQPDAPFYMDADQRVRHFRRFIRKAKLATVQVLLPIPIPGTELYERLDAENRIFSTEQIGLEYYDGNFPTSQPDAPLTPESIQAAAQQIMGYLYRPTALFKIGVNILAFPAIVFHLHRIQDGWQKWNRRWLTNLYRTGGWLVQRQWAAASHRDEFLNRLKWAKRQLGNSGPKTHTS
jgi:radical SAM superfamily enzyme YgiQ (UPF0313 family)